MIEEELMGLFLRLIQALFHGLQRSNQLSLY